MGLERKDGSTPMDCRIGDTQTRRFSGGNAGVGIGKENLGHMPKGGFAVSDKVNDSSEADYTSNAPNDKDFAEAARPSCFSGGRADEQGRDCGPVTDLKALFEDRELIRFRNFLQREGFTRLI